MGGRGQISLFVIIGLVLVIGAVLLFSLQTKTITINTKTSQSEQQIHALVTQCVQTEIELTTRVCSATGFFQNNNPLNFGEIPFFYFANASHLPSKEKIEVEFAKRIIENVYDCLDNFSSVKETFSEELILEKEFIDIDIDINFRDVSATTTIHAKLVTDDSIQEVNKVNTQVPSSLGLLYEQSKLLVTDEKSISRDAVKEFAQKNDIELVSSLGNLAGTIEFIITKYQPLDKGDEPMQIIFLVSP
jgi:hypothetical protein